MDVAFTKGVETGTPDKELTFNEAVDDTLTGSVDTKLGCTILVV